MNTRSRLLALALAFPAFSAFAEFAVAISPPRFELEAKAASALSHAHILAIAALCLPAETRNGEVIRRG